MQSDKLCAARGAEYGIKKKRLGKLAFRSAFFFMPTREMILISRVCLTVIMCEYRKFFAQLSFKKARSSRHTVR